MNKKDIIQIISGVEDQIEKSIFSGDNTNNGIGCNQFRELADICNSAECYEEVELLVRYNEAKDCPPPNSNKFPKSWNHPMRDGRSFADIVIDCMKKIKEQSDENNCLKNLSLFFGYFYWNARIWAAQNSGTNNSRIDTKKSYNNNYNNNKNYNKNNHNNKKRGN